MSPPTALSRYAGAAAVVTGAGGGIGRATALRLAAAGLDVAVLDVQEDLALRTAADVTACGRRGVGLAVDVTDPLAVEAAAAAVIERLELPRVVVASAGVSLRPLRPIWENTRQDWSWVMGVNFWGVVNTVSAFLPGMLELEGARHVVTVNSMSQFRGMSGHSAYVTSKRAAEGYAECLAADVQSHGIGVSIVYPGRVRTDLAYSETLRPEADRSSARQLTAVEIAASSLANNREREPGEVAEAIVSGIADDRRYILTHQPPTEVMLARLGEIVGAPVGSLGNNDTAPVGVAEGRQNQ